MHLAELVRTIYHIVIDETEVATTLQVYTKLKPKLAFYSFDIHFAGSKISMKGKPEEFTNTACLIVMGRKCDRYWSLHCNQT